jgi:uracil-DNA glycosylase
MSDDLASQLWTRLNGLQAAGVDWLPKETGPAPDWLFAVGDSSIEPAVEVDPLVPRRVELKLLAETVAKCQRCPELASTRTQTVFGDGPVGAELLFLGEAPGFDEDKKGIPFVGEAGQLLDKIIFASGLKREEIFICNVLRCRPPGNRTPTSEEAGHCRDYLDKTIDLVGPKAIVCWGATAAKSLLKTSVGITKLRGKFYAYREIPVLCTFHPANLLPSRNPENKKFVWDDMHMLMQHLGRPIVKG